MKRTSNMNHNETLELLKTYTPLVKDYGDTFNCICGYIPNSLIEDFKQFKINYKLSKIEKDFQ